MIFRICFLHNKLLLSNSRFFRYCPFHTNCPCYSETYYDVLGIKSTSTQKEIRSAYLKLCKKYHPDRLDKSSSLFEKNRFLKVNEAYNCLNKSHLRSEYDLKLRQRNHIKTYNYARQGVSYYSPYDLHANSAYRKRYEQQFRRRPPPPHNVSAQAANSTFVFVVVFTAAFLMILQVCFINLMQFSL